jgi:hypothetical protein
MALTRIEAARKISAIAQLLPLPGDAFMPTQSLLDTEFAALWYYPETKIVHHKIKKWIKVDDFKALLEKGHDTAKTNKSVKWLSDDRNNGALPPEVEKWVKDDWFPRMQKLGWKYWALVLPEKIVGQLTVKRHSEEYAKVGITVKMFSDPDEALKWLQSA